jgi:hypothetical protein
MSRLLALRILAVLFAIALWIPALGLADLTASWFLDEETIVHDLGYGAITGILAPIGFLAQLRHPERAIAGLQQVAACVLAYAVAGVIADQRFLVLAAALGAAVVVLLLVHPVGGTFLAIPDEVSPLLLGLALLAVGPFTLYALETAGNQRDGVLPADLHAGLGSWAGLTAMAVGIPLVAVLAGIRTVGWAVPAFSAAGAAAVWGLACVIYPDRSGSEGRLWGMAALAWAAAFALTASRQKRAAAPAE